MSDLEQQAKAQVTPSTVDTSSPRIEAQDGGTTPQTQDNQHPSRRERNPGRPRDTERDREADRERGRDRARGNDRERTAGNERARSRDRGRGRREPSHPFAGLPEELVQALETVSQAFTSSVMSGQQKMDQLIQMGIVPVHVYSGQTRSYTFPSTDSGFRVAIRAIGRAILRIETFKKNVLSGQVVVSDNALSIVRDLGRSEVDETSIPVLLKPLVESAQEVTNRVNTAMDEMFSARDRARTRTSSSQAAPGADTAVGSSDDQPANTSEEPAAETSAGEVGDSSAEGTEAGTADSGVDSFNADLAAVPAGTDDQGEDKIKTDSGETDASSVLSTDFGYGTAGFGDLPAIDVSTSDSDTSQEETKDEADKSAGEKETPKRGRRSSSISA